MIQYVIFSSESGIILRAGVSPLSQVHLQVGDGQIMRFCLPDTINAHEVTDGATHIDSLNVQWLRFDTA